jgi:hypothetical protein
VAEELGGAKGPGCETDAELAKGPGLLFSEALEQSISSILLARDIGRGGRYVGI